MQEEAGALADVFRGAEGFPEPLRSNLQKKCIDYAEEVINDEWKMMEDRRSSEDAWEIYSAVHVSSAAFELDRDLFKKFLEKTRKH